MKKIFCIAVVFGFLFTSCEKDNVLVSEPVDNRVLGKVEPGTYHYENKSNRLIASGCKSKANALCELVVASSGLEVSINLEPLDVDNDFKLNYLRNTLPELEGNLTEREFLDFISYMEFNTDEQLISWSLRLLEKGSGENFENNMIYLTEENGGNSDRIVIIYENGEERVIERRI